MTLKVPAIRFYNHQRAHRIDTRLIRRVICQALPECLTAATSGDAPLLTLDQIEVSFLSDRAIARVHAEFLHNPSPTDVISFDHGEILVSVDTALRQGAAHGEPLHRELCLYIIHGLLHLAGWDDQDAVECDAMRERQGGILNAIYPCGQGLP